jgi:hypothetical protein
MAVESLVNPSAELCMLVLEQFITKSHAVNALQEFIEQAILSQNPLTAFLHALSLSLKFPSFSSGASGRFLPYRRARLHPSRSSDAHSRELASISALEQALGSPMHAYQERISLLSPENMGRWATQDTGGGAAMTASRSRDSRCSPHSRAQKKWFTMSDTQSDRNFYERLPHLAAGM